MSNKIEDLLSAVKLGDMMHRRSPMEKRRHTIVCVLAVIGAIAAVAAIAYAVYRYMNPDYLEDFDDDFDDYEDDFDDDFEEDFMNDESIEDLNNLEGITDVQE